MKTKKCAVSGAEFTITEDDLKFYEKMGVPEPLHHPLERRRIRMAFRNQQHLHKRKCSWTDQLMISQYPSDARFPVIKNEIWYSDQYDPLKYGQEIDWDRPFMDQFYELQSKVPRLCVIQEGEVINSQYTQAAANNKNCYLLFSSNTNEDCLYGTSIVASKDVIDGYRVVKSEICYECTDVVECYELFWGRNCLNCNSSALIENCRSCNNCLYCVNLVNKEYHIWNKKVSKEEFEKERKRFIDLSPQERDVLIKKFESYLPKFPKPCVMNKQVENCRANNVGYSKNAYECFAGRELEDCSYCWSLSRGKDCHDVTQFGGNVEQVYYTQAVGLSSYNIRFCNLVWESQNMTYCDQCFASQDCLLSVGLKKNKYYILNKEYTKEEYEELVPKIQKKLEEEGVWGNFFPPKCSSYSYNQSVAHEYFSLTKDGALAQGYAWLDIPEETKYQGPKYDIPENIKEVSDSITDQVLTCEGTGKHYRLVKPELEFYRKMNLPVPHLSPEERHRRRVERRMPDILWDRNCAECQKDIATTYSPDRSEKVLCEKCYLKAVE